MGFKSKFATELEYHRSQLGWYRDLALGTVATFASMFVVGTLLSEFGHFELMVGSVSLIVLLICIWLTPNWGIPLGGALGFIALSSWYGAIVRGDVRGYWFGIPTTILFILFLRIYGNRKTKS